MAKGIAVGVKRGHIVTKIEKPSWVKGTNRKISTLNLNNQISKKKSICN